MELACRARRGGAMSSGGSGVGLRALGNGGQVRVHGRASSGDGETSVHANERE
jgi:hypothetical protein